MSEISRETVNKCPCCGNEKFDKSFNDYHGISYKACQQCKSVCQNQRRNYTYDDSYWKDVEDPDGNKRDITKERDFNIKPSTPFKSFTNLLENLSINFPKSRLLVG